MDFTENSRNATFSEEIDSLLYTTFVFDACSSFFNALIIYQSLFRVRTSVCRYYALNHACASFAYSFFRFILNLTNITTVGRYFLYKGPRIESDLNDVTRFIHVFLFRYASNSYRILGLLVMLLTYLSYANPELCSRLVTPRITRLLFWGSHVPCLAMCLLVVPRLTEDIHNRRFFIDTIDKKTYAFLMEKGIGLFLLIALTALYILSSYSMRKHAQTAGNTNSISTSRKQLFIVLLSCAIPTLFLYLSLPRHFCIVGQIFGFLDKTSSACAAFRHYHAIATTIRFLLTSLSMLCFFPEYRREFPRLRVSRICRRNAHVHAIA